MKKYDYKFVRRLIMNKRKLLAALMAAIIMIASMPGLAVQADSISKEAQACKELGILIGADSSGVTTQYLSTTPTRVQAYIISLRLKGLYNEAGQYDSSNNFKDAISAGWAMNYLAYAKNKPELGWGGYPDGTFAPGDKISGQAFYKVMLETLGYKQGMDFTYPETLDFAEEIGLVKDADDIAKIKAFTVNDIAKGIYGALNTKPADSDKKLISVMVEKNIISSNKAVAAGFALDTKEAKVTRFNVTSNSRIELEFDEEILLQKGDIEISQLGSSSRLSVLSVQSEGGTAVIATTEAKPFNAYEITVNTLIPTNSMVVKGYKNKFVAMPKDSTRPTARHELLGRNEILVTFNEEVDRITAENLSNYAIEDNVVILSAELGISSKSVLLRTTDMSKFYRLNIRNVTDVSGNKMIDYSELFAGANSDNQGPSIVSVKSENSTTLVVAFNERLDSITAENTDNYSINNNISVIDAKLDDSRKQVRITTSVQTLGVNKLTIQNITDTWDNAMFRKEYNFVGDTSKSTATVLAISNNEVMITFSKGVNKETAEDVDNYSIDNNLDVKNAILDGTGKIVTLITSSQTLREVYTLDITGVTDLWGNEVNTSAKKFGGMPVNNKELSYTVKSNGSTLTVTYSKRVDKETAEDVFNYYLDKELGYAAKATLDEADGRTVTLLTASQVSGKVYSITIKNVKDISGIKISTDEKICTKKFAGINISEQNNGNGELSIETVVTVDVNTIDLVFSDALSEEELADMKAAVTVPDEYSHKLPTGLSYYKFFVGDKKSVRVQFKTSSSSNPELFKAGNIYEVEVTNIDRLNNKDDANVQMFAGTNNPNEAPVVLEVNALNNTAVEVTFSEPVKGIAKSQFEIKSSITISGVSVTETNEITDKVILYISSNTKLDDDEYILNVRSGIKDAAGLNSVYAGSSSSNNYTEFDGSSEDNEAPYIDSDITVMDSYTIQFEFNEPIRDITSSSFSVRKISGSSTSSVNISNAVLSEDRKTVTLYLNANNTGLDSDYEYELGINSTVKDLQDLGVASDNRKTKFDGVDIEIEDLEIIASYIDEDNKKITLLTNRELDISSLTMDDFKLSGAGYYKSSSDVVKFDTKSITITLRNELDSDEQFLIEIMSTGKGRIRDYNNQELSTAEVEVETN
jgi:trimeric autotransporter adhesin